ncbi:hypothetical protein BRC81_13520 [Halobacteriales archaeon QS_1_68_20]|nr:MAG: hypothetical protein BRC81_13520 [Halobacteriales archaeon QS_1_68_20]
MVPTGRRRLLVAGSAALLAGCVSEPPGSTTDDGPDDTAGPTATDGPPAAASTLPDDVRAALAPMPASVDGQSIDGIQLHRPVQDSHEDRDVLGNTFGLDGEAVDRFGVAVGEDGNSVVTIVGSFDATDPDDPAGFATHTEDGLFVGAIGANDEPWQAGLAAARGARDSGTGVVDAHPVARLFGPIADAQHVRSVFDLSGEDTPDGVDPATVDAFAVGTTRVDERTSDVTFVAVFEDEAAASEEAFRTLVEGDWLDVDVREVTVEGRRAVASGVYAAEPRPDPDASPDARFVITYDDETGTATVEHAGDESIPAAALDLHVDGDPAPVSWADEYETVADGDAVSFAAEPFSFVEVRWADSDDEETFDVLTRSVLASRDAFDAVYDPVAEELTITYRGEQPADGSRLNLRHREAGEEWPRSDDETARPLVDGPDATLTTGDQVVLEGVAVGDSVAIMRRVERERMVYASSVFTFTARAPGRFHLVREDGTTYLAYVGTRHQFADGVDPADPSAYRVLVGGDPAANQWADEYGRLSPDDRIAVDADPGETVTVTWTGGDGAVETFSSLVVPEVSIDIDVGADEVTFTHAGGEPVDAGRLRIGFGPHRDEEGPRMWGEAGDTVEAGDSITVDRPDDAKGVGVSYEGYQLASEYFGD